MGTRTKYLQVPKHIGGDGNADRGKKPTKKPQAGQEAASSRKNPTDPTGHHEKIPIEEKELSEDNYSKKTKNCRTTKNRLQPNQ